MPRADATASASHKYNEPLVDLRDQFWVKQEMKDGGNNDSVFINFQ